ncbi:uncharacterized protein SPPG_01759 [Spizellomyces punctatus DAOM BR117]|uniref:Alpha/beta hydrolase fold-3 domain-containing protein n=1 Tax=Spizellomyces punctatus (strain DAOM BR117) TaxID=645134 RepID=A0A0L0HPF3_SPIPD|nr:uncharacterized protein SPPG_01759 [Spizellomyces punctatus DAOM BR117]KND02674.1 hypothetical protein SPPG_01759 [Spizellomyces punctatus DAOM BR117]|eukprot:XP_016610713.1 hypothetical protein SPPG_01759 [Spizellomyces punctatus DAOM BR117]
MTSPTLLLRPITGSFGDSLKGSFTRTVLSGLIGGLRFLFNHVPSLVTPASLRAEWEGLSSRTRAFLLLVKLSKQPHSTDVEHVRERTEAIVNLVVSKNAYSVSQLEVNGVPTEIITAVVTGPTPPGAVVWLHGGGYMAGRAHHYRGIGADLSARLGGVPIVIPDYRLVPEADFLPESVGDCIKVFEWATARYGASNLALIGDSAGGGMTVHVINALRRTPQYFPAGVVMLSPYLNLHPNYPSMETNKSLDVMLDAPSISFVCSLVLKSPTPIPPPTYEEFPPALVLVGSHELLLDDSKEIAENIAKDGGDVELIIQKGMCHVYPVFFAWLDESEQAMHFIANWIRAKVGWKKQL